jgi:prolyl oligopeptidase
MLVRYPERFGALFCTIPLIDMRRYTKLLAGASWIAEYGDPDKPEEWAWL